MTEMTGIIIPAYLIGKMVAHCRSAFPHEACGLLAGKGRVVAKIYPMTNAESSAVSYLMDPREQFIAMKEMRAEGNKMLAIYHSHPCSRSYPSARDVELAFYPDSVYIIVGLADISSPEIRAYEINEGAVREVVIEGPA